MAKVVRRQATQADVDWLLTTAHRSWSRIPALAGEWEGWDEASRLHFSVDWPVEEDRLSRLQEWAAQGLLTPAQRRRYDDLLRLVARNRPLLERLLAD